MNPQLKKALEDARAALKEAKSKRLKAAVQGKNGTSGLGKSKDLSEVSRKSLREWGVKSFDELITVNTADRKYAYLAKEKREQVKALKESVDIAVMCSRIFNKPVEETKYFQEELQFHMKVLGIGVGETGFEWIPTLVSDSYIEEFLLERKVAGLFLEVKMPSNPYKWPVLTQGAIARKVGEVQALATPQAFKTDKTILFDAVKMTNQYALPEELAEDSAPDVIKVIRQQLVEGQEKAMEIAILEGDASDVSHFHAYSGLVDVAAATPIANVPDSPEFFFDGIRKRLIAAGASAVVDAGANSVTEAELSQMRAKMGKFGVDPSMLAMITGPKVYNQMLQLDDVRTIEQYGAQATVLVGELAKYEGIPVIVSEYLREDLNTNGVNDATLGNNTKASILLVNRKRWFVGTRRAIQIKVENNRTQYDVLDLVSFARKAFQAVLKTDGSNYTLESSGAWIKNIAV